jgi:hypothetical protein
MLYSPGLRAAQSGAQKEAGFFVKFQVVMAASMKMTAIWDMALCSLVEVDQCFRGI